MLRFTDKDRDSKFEIHPNEIISSKEVYLNIFLKIHYALGSTILPIYLVTGTLYLLTEFI